METITGNEQAVHFRFVLRTAPSEAETALLHLANAFADLAGLRWEAWLLNRQTREAGALRLFDDPASAEAFLVGSLAALVRQHTELQDVNIQRFAIQPTITAITHGPLNAGVGI